MAEQGELVTVFRSADPNAEEQATVARDMLLNAGYDAEVFDDSAPGVPEGAFEVRVPRAQQADAEQLIDTQKDFSPEPLDLSHDLDMVTVFVSDAPDAEMLAHGNPQHPRGARYPFGACERIDVSESALRGTGAENPPGGSAAGDRSG